jgi:hypothetical protein
MTLPIYNHKNMCRPSEMYNNNHMQVHSECSYTDFFVFFHKKERKWGDIFDGHRGGRGTDCIKQNESLSFTRSQRETWLNNLTCKKVHGNEIITNNIGNLREPAAAAASQVSAH